MVDAALGRIGIDEEEDADAVRETVLDGALPRVKEWDEVKSCDAAHTCRGECRREIFSGAEDGSTDVGRRDVVCAQDFRDEFLGCLPDFFFFVASNGNGAAYATHTLHSLVNIPDEP